MKINIPFIRNRGFECGQTCAAMTIKYFYPDFIPDFEEFNRIIRHKAGKYTYPLQNAYLLHYFGLKAKCFSSSDSPTTDEDPDVFKKWFGKELDNEIKYIDEDACNWIVVEGRKNNLFELRTTSVDDLVGLCKEGHVVTFAVDWNRLKNKQGTYNGHFVVLSGVDNGKLLIHDPDEGPWIEYSQELIDFAYHHPAITDDVFIGKKSSLGW